MSPVNFATLEKKGRPPRRRRLKGERGRGTLAKEKPTHLGDDRAGRGGGDSDAGERTTGHDRPADPRTIAPGTDVYTDEYDIYARLPEWGYTHRTVCHAAGEFARDEDGDGFCEVHVNTIQGF